jgi:hypothetical protein
METLSDDEIKKGILDHLTNIMRKKNNNPVYQLPALKQINATRWHTEKFFLVR